MIEWGRVPWSLWLYVVSSVAFSGWFVFQVSGPVTARVLFSAIILTWAFYLLKGLRWLWIATVVVVALSFISGLITGPRTWYGIAGGVISLGLLLAPATRRYFASEPPTLAPSEG